MHTRNTHDTPSRCYLSSLCSKYLSLQTINTFSKIRRYTVLLINLIKTVALLIVPIILNVLEHLQHNLLMICKYDEKSVFGTRLSGKLCLELQYNVIITIRHVV